MAIEECITHTISAEWPLKGPKPTVADIIKIAEDLKKSHIPRDTVVDFEPPYSDITSYPARFFIKPITLPRAVPATRKVV